MSNSRSRRALRVALSFALVAGLGTNALAQFTSARSGDPISSPESAPAKKSIVQAKSIAVPPGLVRGGLYGTDGQNLFLIDKTNGTATFIGAHGPVEFEIGSLAFNALGDLYGVSATADAKLYSIDVTTGAATAVGPIGLGFVFEGGLAPGAGLGFFSANYGNSGDSRSFSIELNGAGTDLGPNPGAARDINGMAFDAGTVYALERLSNTLGTINQENGAYTAIGDPGVAIGIVSGLSADPEDGTLYAAFESTGALYTLDKGTGLATMVGVNNVTTGLAFAPLFPEPDPGPVPLDHFMFYRSRDVGAKLPTFGLIGLEDEYSNRQYIVPRLRAIGVPADKEGEGIGDPDTHLVEYQLRRPQGTSAFQKISGVLVRNQCNTMRVQLRKPDALLVPSNKDLDDPVLAPSDADHDVDHYLCYKVRVQSGFRRNMQVEVTDQFEEERRYDLKKVTRVCFPAEKTGNPIHLRGPQQGQPFPITPASVQRSDEFLTCYKAKLARKNIPQSDVCRPAASSGPPLGQLRHARRFGVHVNNQFGARVLDTVREQELCIPSRHDLPPTPTPRPSPSPSPSPFNTPTPAFTPTPTPTPPGGYGSASQAFVAPTNGGLLR